MRQIFVLDVTLIGGNYQVLAAYWLTAPATRVVPTPNFISQVPSESAVAPTGITSIELAALRSGAFVEQVRTIQLAASGQTQVGSSYDGTSWTSGP